MRVLFDGQVHVHYSQMYVESDLEGFGGDLETAFAGQVNGLCGGLTPGSLFLTTGLHTGYVAVTVESHATAPAADGAWEEIVEVSFTPRSSHVFLVEWGGGASWPLRLGPTDYRVRLCASGMEQARAKDTRMDGEPELDRYLLQFWPGPAEPDRVVKQTSEIAAYRHRFAGQLPQRRTNTG